jgi:hypothetical protein
LPESLASKVGDTQLQVQINAKGQEISKGNYGVFNYSKKKTRKFLPQLLKKGRTKKSKALLYTD